MSDTSSSDGFSDLELLENLTDWEDSASESSDEDQNQRPISQTRSQRLYKTTFIKKATKPVLTRVTKSKVDQNPNKKYRDRVNYFVKFDDAEFTYRFRLDKSSVENLLKEIYPFIRVTSRRNHGISPLHQLLLTLRFYALGTMLVSVADFVGVSKSSASRIIKDISQAIAKLYSKNIFIHSDTEKSFYLIARFPRVLGAIGCTHIPIQSPSAEYGGEFKDGKSVFSLNVQAVCDANLKIMNVVTRPGSAHDTTIFNQSELRAFCENGEYGNRWLLGDSAYPCKPYLLTPLQYPQTDSEYRYNNAHMLTKNTIDRCIAVWKQRFPILSLKIRLSLDNAQAVIMATAVLHNISRDRGLADIETEVAIPEHQFPSHGHVQEPYDENESQERRDLINNHYTNIQ